MNSLKFLIFLIQVAFIGFLSACVVVPVPLPSSDQELIEKLQTILLIGSADKKEIISEFGEPDLETDHYALYLNRVYEGGTFIFAVAAGPYGGGGMYAETVGKETFNILLEFDNHGVLANIQAEKIPPFKGISEFTAETEYYLKNDDLRWKKIWDVSVDAHKYSALSRDGSLLGIIGNDFQAYIQHRKTFEVLKLTEGGAVYGLTFSSDNKLGIITDKIEIYDTITAKKLAAFNKSQPTCLAFSPDGQWVAAGGRVGEIIAWDLSSGREIQNFHTGEEVKTTGDIVGKIEFSPDGKILAASAGGRIKFWNLPNGKFSGEIDARGNLFTFSPNGKLLAVHSGHFVSVWDLEETQTKGFKSIELQPKGIFLLPKLRVFKRAGLAFSPDNKYLVASNGIVVIFDIRSMRRVWVNNFSPDVLPEYRLIPVAGKKLIAVHKEDGIFQLQIP